MFIRTAADALDLLEVAIRENDWEESTKHFTSKEVLYVEPRFTAHAGLTILGTVLAFVATCFAKKVFDEFYDRLLKRPVGAYVDALLEKLQLQEDKLLEFRDVVYFDDLEMAIVIRLLTKTPGASRIDADLIKAHRLAYTYLAKNGRMAPIHCHRILDGKVDAEPALLLSLEHLQHEDKASLRTLRTYGAPKSDRT